jgi:AbrB family looped-hinge helix DNA binding protein
MAQIMTKMSTKGQVVIPSEVRKKLGLEPGTPISIEVSGHRLIIEPQTLKAKIQHIKAMRGITAGRPSGTDMLLEDRRMERERELREEGW